MIRRERYPFHSKEDAHVASRFIPPAFIHRRLHPDDLRAKSTPQKPGSPPRTLQPDGSQTTEDWLREVVFGTERPEPAATPDARATVTSAPGISPTPATAVSAGIASIAGAGLSPEEQSSPLPYGWRTTLFPGRDALSLGSGSISPRSRTGSTARSRREHARPQNPAHRRRG